MNSCSKDLEEKLSISIPNTKLAEVKEDLESEVKRLKQQLKWYVENQQLIENNIEAVQEKDKEIALLKERLSKKVCTCVCVMYGKQSSGNCKLNWH